MSGGPSHMDTWNLKPESEKNGGPFKPIETSAPGVLISEHLPTVAKQMKHLSVVRSLNSKEGNHDRGTYMMHTGYAPNPTVVHSSFGSSFAFEIGGSDGMALPNAISINGPGVGAGFLGMAYSPFVISNPNGKVANLEPPKGVDDLRMMRRLSMLKLVENNFIAQRRGQGSVDHRDVYEKTIRMMSDRRTKAALSLDSEPPAVRDEYGRNSFGAGCLMARKLIEQGVTFVEVSLGGWDTHRDAFNTLSTRLLPELDKGMGALVADLDQRGLLDSTVIAWMGDFGRTPRINQDSGRDHWPRSWSVVLGGGGIKGGQAVGDTDKDGIDIVDRPVGPMDLIATMTRAMGIDLSTQWTTPRGRPIKLVDAGTPIKELI
jgi:hypothetical protein